MKFIEDIVKDVKDEVGAPPKDPLEKYLELRCYGTPLQIAMPRWLHGGWCDSPTSRWPMYRRGPAWGPISLLVVLPAKNQ